ncbi:hypothetical protein L6452_42409 [Arctium lappa]|uniref:Uncharacterized protein n=1 Tax=Arctium lappa TaxID=4217 RepID=A0ACB8XI63_ARCLA|nr:hypothetical protein L6452_42409 [Arctium lappa]
MDTRDVQIITSHGYRLNIPSIFISPARTKSLEKMEATKSPEKMDQIDGHGRPWKPPNRWKKKSKKTFCDHGRRRGRRPPSSSLDFSLSTGYPPWEAISSQLLSLTTTTVKRNLETRLPTKIEFAAAILLQRNRIPRVGKLKGWILRVLTETSQAAIFCSLPFDSSLFPPAKHSGFREATWTEKERILNLETRMEKYRVLIARKPLGSKHESLKKSLGT